MTGPEPRTPRNGAPPESAAAEESVLSILRQELHAAPAAARATLRFAMLGFTAGLAMILFDLWDSDAEERFRLLGLTFGVIGLALLALGQAAHALSQRGTTCSSGALQLRSEQLHRLLLAVPLLLLLSAICLAAGIGVLIHALVRTPLHAVSVLLFSVYLLVAARGMSTTNRFLYRHAREQAAAAMQAEAAATEARLATLQSQLNPHFLFNALNTVASLVQTDPKRAEETVENLADVLRRTLERSQRPLSSVREELEYLRAYLDVEGERWGSRLHVEWCVEPETESLLIPTLTLQPLVENSLKHGFAMRREGGTVRIAVRRVNRSLLLSVSDDGEGFDLRPREGTGLGNLRQRLSALYGEAAELRIDAPEASGASVTVAVPIAAGTTNGAREAQ